MGLFSSIITGNIILLFRILRANYYVVSLVLIMRSNFHITLWMFEFIFCWSRLVYVQLNFLKTVLKLLWSSCNSDVYKLIFIKMDMIFVYICISWSYLYESNWLNHYFIFLSMKIALNSQNRFCYEVSDDLLTNNKIRNVQWLYTRTIIALFIHTS